VEHQVTSHHLKATNLENDSAQLRTNAVQDYRSAGHHVVVSVWSCRIRTVELIDFVPGHPCGPGKNPSKNVMATLLPRTGGFESDWWLASAYSLWDNSISQKRRLIFVCTIKNIKSQYADAFVCKTQSIQFP